MTEPTIWGTQKEFAWDAFQKAFDAGKVEPERWAFDKWWDDVALHTTWEHLHNLMEGAWQAGVYHRNGVCTALFNGYWDNNPTLTMSLEKVMWTAYQAAFDAGKLLPSYTAFQEWWAIAQSYGWLDLHEEMEAAWTKGVQDRITQSAAGFNAWWQEILDSQPVIGKTE